MKRNFTYLYFLLGATLITSGAMAQAVGDYRTNGTGGGNWSALATWQTWDGASWVAPAHTPTSADGQIDILSGDNVLEDVAGLTVDQLIVDAGGTLTATQGGSPILTLNLNDGPGDDLVVNGSFSLGGGYTFQGTGSADAVVNSGGTMLWTSGLIQTTITINSGGIFNMSINLSAPFDKHIVGSFTNNGVWNWGTGTDVSGIFMDGATITNNGTINENFMNMDHGLNDEAGTNAFVNHGIINKNSTLGFFNQGVPFTHDGTFNGIGFVSLTGASNSITGTFVPGAINGATTNTMGVVPTVITGQSPNLKSYIGSSGDVAGTNYDQLTVQGGGSIDISGATLTVLDLGSDPDPVGTVYTVLTTSSGTITGTFANTVLSTNLGNVTNTGTSITVQKTSGTVLPLNWGPFTAVAQGNTVVLNWSTYQEENTSHFNVQTSSGGDFATIGTVTAAGNSVKPSKYSFTQTDPTLNGINQYRIVEVDQDGKMNYSKIQAVRFTNGQAVKVQATPNPVHDLLQLNVQELGLSAVLVDASGRALRTWILQPGSQQVSVSNLPVGMYQLVIYQHAQQIDVQHILKF